MVAVGVGGYASGPTLKVCAERGIPCLIQEQNSYAGVTNKLLAKKAAKICVAYEGMERFFPADKLIMTGNPVRQNVLSSELTPEEARKSFGLEADKKTILLVGGSLGARTINESVRRQLDLIKQSDVQFIWQTGKFYFDEMTAAVKAYGELPNLNVAEDHQTKNTMALVDKDAAVYVKDADAPATLIPTALDIVEKADKLASLHENILKMALKNSAEVIADEVVKLAWNEK